MAGPAQELHDFCDVLESTLSGDARAGIVDALFEGADGAKGLDRLRSALRAQKFHGPGGALAPERAVRRLDHRTRSEGFRVLHSWDHTAHRFTEDITPVLMLDYVRREVAESEGRLAPDPRITARVLLDYYFMHLLALCAMRAWDAEDPDALLDRLTGLVGALQGPDGSGHRFVGDAETLIIYALSQFHPEEHAYDRLIDKFAPLRLDRRVRFAAVSAAVLGSHLRWGFWLMYDRDVQRMRDDNVGDYPWLLDSVATLLRAWEAQGSELDRGAILDGLLQGLAADPWAFIARKPPEALRPFADLQAQVRSLLARHGPALVEDLGPLRPSKSAYAPLSLHFNFPHNALVALVAIALLEGRPQSMPLDALFRRHDAEDVDPAPVARALMRFSGASPDRRGAHGAMLVAYDPLSGMRSYSMTVDAIQEVAARG